MKPHVLVVCKRSLLDLLGGEDGDASFQAMVDEHEVVRERHERAHTENEATIAAVRDALEKAGCTFVVQERPLLNIMGEDVYDLVVCVGGDGTFLSTAHSVQDIPMLGVNSSTTFSVGRYCGANIETFGSMLAGIIDGKYKPSRVYRLQVKINGKIAAPPVLNEVLFANKMPAGTSRYILTVGDRAERQKSSGIWVATATGSTAAIRSAGGSPMPAGMGELQYLIREPYPQPGVEVRLRRGIHGETIRVESRMQDGFLFVDGPRAEVVVPWGAIVEFVPGSYPLDIYWGDYDVFHPS